MFRHYLHNLHAIKQTIIGMSEQNTTTCKDYSYVIAIVGELGTFFRLLRMSHYTQNTLLNIPARGNVHVAATSHVVCQNDS